jgi:hypothetical protein
MKLDAARTTQCAKRPAGGAAPPPLTEIRQSHYFPVRYSKCYWVPGESCDSGPFFPLSKTLHYA